MIFNKVIKYFQSKMPCKHNFELFKTIEIKKEIVWQTREIYSAFCSILKSNKTNSITITLSYCKNCNTIQLGTYSEHGQNIPLSVEYMNYLMLSHTNKNCDDYFKEWRGE